MTAFRVHQKLQKFKEIFIDYSYHNSTILNDIKEIFLGLPSGRVLVPTFRLDLDRMPGRVSIPRLGTDPPVPTLKTDAIR